MERADAKVLAKHWRWEKDREGLAWLTFDKQGESANTFSREALNELSLMLDEIGAARPKGLVIRSAKDSFIGGADINTKPARTAMLMLFILVALILVVVVDVAGDVTGASSARPPSASPRGASTRTGGRRSRSTSTRSGARSSRSSASELLLPSTTPSPRPT